MDRFAGERAFGQRRGAHGEKRNDCAPDPGPGGHRKVLPRNSDDPETISYNAQPQRDEGPQQKNRTSLAPFRAFALVSATPKSTKFPEIWEDFDVQTHSCGHRRN